MPQSILIVMHDASFGQTLQQKLSQFRVKVFRAETAAQALELLGRQKMNVVLLDVRGNALPAVPFLKELKATATEVETIVISSIDDVAISIECMQEGASDEITVPFDIESLKGKIKEAVKRSRLRQKKKRKFAFFDNFENDMVAATFAQMGEFDSARTILDKKKDESKTDDDQKKSGKKHEK
ncbi:MAG: response regulator [Desulfobulbaceae bacterium]